MIHKPCTNQSLTSGDIIKMEIRPLKLLDIFKIKQPILHSKFFIYSELLASLFVFKGYVTEINSEIIAYMIVKKDYIAQLEIKPNQQSKGLGQKNIAYLQETHDKLSAHVRVSNKPCLHMLDQRDFVIVKEIEKYYKDGENAYFLEWRKNY